MSFLNHNLYLGRLISLIDDVCDAEEMDFDCDKIVKILSDSVEAKRDWYLARIGVAATQPFEDCVSEIFPHGAEMDWHEIGALRAIRQWFFYAEKHNVWNLSEHYADACKVQNLTLENHPEIVQRAVLGAMDQSTFFTFYMDTLCKHTDLSPEDESDFAVRWRTLSALCNECLGDDEEDEEECDEYYEYDEDEDDLSDSCCEETFALKSFLEELRDEFLKAQEADDFFERLEDDLAEVFPSYTVCQKWGFTHPAPCGYSWR